MIAGDTRQLAELVSRKRALLIELRELGRQQLEVIESGDMARLLDLLSAKQRIISQVQVIEQSLDPFRQQQPEDRRWESEAARRQCADELAECDAIYYEIVTQERQSEHTLRARRDEAAARLENVQHASQARGAYTETDWDSVRQLDISSEG